MSEITFTGEFKHTVDPKFRMFLPASMREKLAGDIVLTKNVDCCVAVYPMSAWKSYTAKLDQLPELQARNVRRFIYSSATETQLDSQGRVLIPQNLREYACLNKNVCVIGVGDHAEIWDEDKWNEQMSGIKGEDLADTLIGLGF